MFAALSKQLATRSAEFLEILKIIDDGRARAYQSVTIAIIFGKLEAFYEHPGG
jgi:hypothetical protein